MHIRKAITFITSVLVAGLMTVGPSQLQAAEKELKFGHVGKPGSLLEFSVNDFAKRANAALAGKGYKVVGHGSSQLGNDKELLKKLKSGAITFSLPSSVMSSVSGSFAIFDMPYMIKNREHVKKLLKPIIWKKLNKVIKRKQYEIIGIWENGFRHFTNDKHPINTPADLKGTKSQEKTLAQIKQQGAQKYLSLTGHVYTPAYVMVSRKHWKKMPKDIKKILMTAAKETQGATYKKAAALDASLLDSLKKAGIKVNKTNRMAFVDAGSATHNKFATSINGAFGMLNQVNSLGEGL